jgi:uncharacterized protein YndB with AHSA1/START domain
MTDDSKLRLVVRRRIQATSERLFDAWTSPEQLLAWWGPVGVRCTVAELELFVGGRYRLGNELPDGQIIYIVGEFLEIERPVNLVYTWSTEGSGVEPETVKVSFNAGDGETEVVIVHERIQDRSRRDEHEGGWMGCLDGLAEHVFAVG